MILDKLDIYIVNNFHLYLTAHEIVNSRYIRLLNVKNKAIKHLEETYWLEVGSITEEITN